MPVSTDQRDTILQRQRDGATITQIAQELGLSRTTVYKSLSVVDNLESYIKDKSSNIRRLAYNAVEKGLSTNRRDSARLGLEWLKLTDLAVEHGDTFNVRGDVHMQAITAMIPSTASTAGITSTDSQPSTAGDTTQAAAKPPGHEICISNHTNFSEFSAAQLDQLQELVAQELARRKTCGSANLSSVPQEDSLPAQAQRRLAEVSGSGEIIDAEVEDVQR